MINRVRFVLCTMCLCAAVSYPQSSWFWQNPKPQESSLQSVSFANADVGTTGGCWGAIIRTTDGGDHWINQSIEMPAFFTFYGVSCPG